MKNKNGKYFILTQGFVRCLSSLDDEFVIKEFRFDIIDGDEFES
jgi:hypothetical protein